MSIQINMYTDGSCLGNPGPGGYGVILISGSLQKELSQGYQRTTNNRMELMAVIAGLKALKMEGMTISVYSDSQYVVKAVQQGWLERWITTNFKGGKKNEDLWREYYQLSQKQHVSFNWIKGHSANPHNKRCDQLAKAAAVANQLLPDIQQPTH